MTDQPDHNQRLNENGVSPVLMIAFHKHHFDGSSTSASPCHPRFCGFSWMRRYFSSCHPRFWLFSWTRRYFSSCHPRFGRVFMDETSFFELPSTIRAVFMDGSQNEGLIWHGGSESVFRKPLSISALAQSHVSPSPCRHLT